ncbi:phosphatidyl inositol 3-phosphate binding protein, putative [Candida dubliniensis CD36]|uniref:Phosphatidyl inositol 3-phosphate binding protein, putative n=1 Tax=Candida dubliniensis (strain CD36 / ATCC MYA-646 / CBS 7987 / NCPF 3949 / NRRL Y-17841) TaxID=573826 RepID=B9WDF2_CANDC|nr:phosphatidyl inositol 3-phosphate binding protein, putative [Candida dubliniensis CD36]CAX42705.1 phosphatidyl inositol 3-phosphate binding protein, putative [Candida dubliniensis CD36]
MADTKVLSPTIPSQDEVMTQSQQQQQVNQKYSSGSTQSPTLTPDSQQFSKNSQKQPRYDRKPLTPSAILQDYNNNTQSSSEQKMVSTASTTPISTNNNTPKRGKQQQQQQQQQQQSEELGSFSFTKKDIVKVNSVASDLHSNITSSICRSDKSSCRNSTGTSTSTTISNNNNNNKNNTDDDLTFKDFDYDEQIRFPRVNTYYTYSTKKTSFSSNEDKPSTKSHPSSDSIFKHVTKEEQTQGQLNEGDKEHEHDYTPANFDLNQPLRRYSVPLQLKESPEEQLLHKFAENNKIYERSMKSGPESASESESESESNIDSPPQLRLKNQTSFLKTKEINYNKHLKPLYQLKKPLLTPAVLRPAYTNEHENLPPPTVIPPTSSYTIIIPNSDYFHSTGGLPNCTNEPVHDHWKDNALTSNCMWCVKPFHNPIVSMICDVPRRHHCRFCGLIFCADCLVNKTILIDHEARFVIPILSNTTETKLQQFFTNSKSKVCKKCGMVYDNLIEELNKSETEYTTSFVLVDNPFRKDHSKGNDYSFAQQQLEQQSSHTEKRLSVADVPNDWVWSSF